MYFTLTNDADTVLSGEITFDSVAVATAGFGGGDYTRWSKSSITYAQNITMIWVHHSSGFDLFQDKTFCTILYRFFLANLREKI